MVIEMLSDRPVQWLKSSGIITAHSTQPHLVYIQFPSSKQHILSAPQPLSTTPSLYDPASVISISPRSDWIFAYFPGKDGEGVGCLWACRDFDSPSDWVVKDWWTVQRDAGVICASWLGADREVSRARSIYVCGGQGG